MRVTIQIAPGELLDKLTILSIKAERITDPGKLASVRREAEMLQAARESTLPPLPGLDGLVEELRAVNAKLWDIEDDIRRHEQRRDFGPDFVGLARAVYQTNDLRAEIKHRINDLLGTDIAEEKSYA